MKKIVMALVIFMLMAGTAQAFPNEPTGFQFWKFGMTFEEAEPWLEYVEKDPSYGYTTYKAPNSKFFDCSIGLEVSFHRGKLVKVEFKGHDLSFGDIWLTEFIKQFGEPTDPLTLDSGSFFHVWKGDLAVVYYWTTTNPQNAIPYMGKYSNINVTIYDRRHYDLMNSLHEYNGW